MEHRWSPRKYVDCPVRIFRRGQYLGDGLIRDVSRDGLFIETMETTFSGGIMLDLASDSKTQEEVVRLKVYIVRVETEGAGAICLGESPLDRIERTAS